MSADLPVLPSRHGAPAPRVRHGDVLDEVGSHAARGSRAFLVTDPGLRATPWPARVAASLHAAGVPVVVFDDVAPNPGEAAVARAAGALRDSGADVVVALGGGSVLDTAKAAALLVANEGPMGRWRGYHDPPGPIPPLIAIPATAGTGSEAQSFALVSRDADHAKLACGARGLMPTVVLLDPRVTVTAPRGVTIEAALDATVHALETAVTTARTAASQAMAEEAFGLLWTHLPRVVEAPDDLDARAAMQRGAFLAGTAVEASMLGAAHAAANPLTARLGVAHGLAVGVLAAPVVRFNAALPEIAAIYERLAASVGLPPSAGALADALTARLRALGVPPDPLAAWGADDVDALAADAATQWTGTFNPRPVEAGVFAVLYGAVREG